MAASKLSDFYLRFARAVCPEAPAQFLHAGENAMLGCATVKIEDLTAEVARLQKEVKELRKEARGQ